MTTTGLIAARDFCIYHRVDHAFIILLNEAGLIEIHIIDDTLYIPEDEIIKLEKLIRLHQELEININGIEAIHHLLQRVEGMQQELLQLKNRLKLYE